MNWAEWLLVIWAVGTVANAAMSFDMSLFASDVSKRNRNDE